MTNAPKTSGKDGFRANVLPWVMAALVAGCAAYFAFRSYRGLPDAANPGKGDFEHFYHAAKAMAEGSDIYASHTRGYIYPPLLALILRPVAGMELRPAQLVWAGANLVMVAATIAVALSLAVGRFKIPRERLTLWTTAAFGLLLAFEPVRQEIEEGQTDTIVGLCLVLAVAALTRKPWLAGVCIGLGANIKYQALAVVPYLLVRKQWKAAGSAIASTAVFALLPAVVVGWERNLQYLGVAFGGVAKLLGVQPTGEVVKTHDIRWEKSISITSGIAKTLGAGVSDTVVLGIAGVVAFAVLGVAWWMYRSVGAGLICGQHGEKRTGVAAEGLRLVEWSGLLVAVLAFSPQTLIRHMYILLPVMVWAAAMVLVPRRGVPRTVLVGGLVLLIAGMLLPPGNVKSFEPTLNGWRSIGGTGWCAVVMYLALLWTGLRYTRAVEEGRELTDPPPGYGVDGSRLPLARSA